MAVQEQLGLTLATARSDHAEVEFSEAELRMLHKRLLADLIGNLRDNLAGTVTAGEMTRREVEIQTVRVKLARLLGELP